MRSDVYCYTMIRGWEVMFTVLPWYEDEKCCLLFYHDTRIRSDVYGSICVFQCMQAVVSEEQSLGVCQQQYTQLESSIMQRLKWAAGANPSLNLTLQQFEDASAVRKQLAEVSCTDYNVSLLYGVIVLNIKTLCLMCSLLFIISEQ